MIQANKQAVLHESNYRYAEPSIVHHGRSGPRCSEGGAVVIRGAARRPRIRRLERTLPHEHVVCAPCVPWRVCSLPVCSSICGDGDESDSSSAGTEDSTKQHQAPYETARPEKHDDDTAPPSSPSEKISASLRSQRSHLLLQRLFGPAPPTCCLGGSEQSTTDFGDGGVAYFSRNNDGSKHQQPGEAGVMSPLCSITAKTFTGCATGSVGDESKMSCNSLPFERGRTEALRNALRSAGERTRSSINVHRLTRPPTKTVRRNDNGSNSSCAARIPSRLLILEYPPTSELFDQTVRPRAVGRTGRLSAPLWDPHVTGEVKDEDGKRTDAIKRRRQRERPFPSSGRGGGTKLAETAVAGVIRPPELTLSPRPIWSTLRRRTLEATQRDPSIFSPGIQSQCQSARVAKATTPRTKRWHIMNRRIFGFRERPIRGGVIQPEWLVFAGGVPAQGIGEDQRWMLRLGYVREYIPA